MAEVDVDMTQLARLVIEQLRDQFSWAIFIVQAVGIMVLVYILFRLIGMFLEYNKRRRIKRIEQKVGEIDEKLDRVLKTLKQKDPKQKKKKQ